MRGAPPPCRSIPPTASAWLRCAGITRGWKSTNWRRVRTKSALNQVKDFVMCGIAGLLLPPDQPVQRQSLEQMGQMLKHRGPDHFAIWHERSCGLAHTRLSIIDVTDCGNQPFIDERYVLTYNGEIYNYQALREAL